MGKECMARLEQAFVGRDEPKNGCEGGYFPVDTILNLSIQLEKS